MPRNGMCRPPIRAYSACHARQVHPLHRKELYSVRWMDRYEYLLAAGKPYFTAVRSFPLHQSKTLCTYPSAILALV